MEKVENEGNHLEGIDLVFEMGLKQIDDQLKSVESIDLKISVLIGFLGLILVTTSGFVVTAREILGRNNILQYFFILGILLIFVALFRAFRSLRTSPFRLPFNLEEFVQWANMKEKEIKDNFVGDILDAFRHNQYELEKKTSYFKSSMRFTLSGLLFFTIPLIVILLKGV